MRAPAGCGLQTNALPAARMLIALPASVGSECVTGVMMPTTPKGAFSSSTMPLRPENAFVLRYSTPGVFSPATISFSTLCLSRPILVSSNSSRPSCSALPMQIRRTQSTAFLRSSMPRRSYFCWARLAAATALSTSSNTPQVLPMDLLGAAPFFMCPSTSWTTLRIRSSVTVNMVKSHALFAVLRPQGTLILQGSMDALNVNAARSLFRVKDRLVFHVHRVHDADDRRVHGQLLRLGRQAGAGALHNEHYLPLAGADGVHANKCPPGADE